MECEKAGVEMVVRSHPLEHKMAQGFAKADGHNDSLVEEYESCGLKTFE
jgi:hypothetical protein